MESQKHYAMIGLFIIVTGASFIGVTLWLAFGDFTKGYRTYVAYMEESVSGLYIDAPVKYQGVDVGRVTGLDLDTYNPQRVRIMLAVRPDIHISQDTVATLTFQGLTGIASVDLSGGTSGAPPLEADEGEKFPIIKTRPSLFVRFDAAVSALMTSVNRVAEDTHRLMSPENIRNVDSLLANLESLSGTLSGQRQQLAQSVTDFSRLVEGGARAAEQLPGLVAALDRSAASVRTTADDMLATSQSVRRGVNQMRDDVHLLAGRAMPEVTAMVPEIRDLVGSLQRLSHRLEEDPRQILYGSTLEPPGPGE